MPAWKKQIHQQIHLKVHYFRLLLPSGKAVSISPADPVLCHCHPSPPVFSETWLQDVVLKKKHWNTESMWCLGMEEVGASPNPAKPEEAEPSPAKLSWKELSRVGWSGAEQSKSVVLAAAMRNWVQHPKQRCGVKSAALPEPQHNTDDLAFGSLSIVVVCCHRPRDRRELAAW